MTSENPLDSQVPSSVEPDNLPILALLRQLLDDSERLARAELGLAQAQLTKQFSALIPGVLAILFGSIFALASLFTMLAALIGWLTPSLGAGNAALVVTLGTAAIGGVAISLGVRHLNHRSVPRAARAKELE